MSDWWLELAMIPDVTNHQDLAQKVWASFELPWQIVSGMVWENYDQAPSAPLCICRKDFLPGYDLKFSCWDIRESQLEKTVAYEQALQFWWRKLICLLKANHAFWQGVS